MKALTPFCFATVAFVALSAPASAADYEPLDCKAAASATERAICGSYTLGQHEARMATLYEWATQFVGMGQRGDIQDAQRAFIKAREVCGADAACIGRAYDKRIAALLTVMEHVKESGPF